MPRCLSAVLLACACALVAPAAADAAYDLTISNGTTSGVTITNPTSRVTLVTASGPGATLNVGELATRMASSASSDALRLASGAGGTGAGDVTLTVPLTSTGTLDLRNAGVFTIDADLSVGTLNGFSGGGVVASTATVTASSTMLFEDPLQLAADVTLRGGLAMLQQGARGEHALRAESSQTQIEGDVGSAAAPVASFTATTGLLLKGTVHATGTATVDGDLHLLGNAGLSSVTGAVQAGRAFDTQISAAYDLTLASPTVVRFGGATSEPPRTLTVTAPSILLAGSTAARSQVLNGHVTTDGDLTLTGTLSLKLEDGLTIGAGRTVRVDGGEGSWVRGGLRGTATSTLEVDADPAFLLTSPTPSDPVAIAAIGTGRLDLLGTFPGTVSVASGTLGGGPTLGPLTLGSAATIAPGQVPGSPATLTAARLTLQAGATVRLQGRAGATPFDRVRVLGDAALGGATLALPGAASAELEPGASVALVEVGGTVTGALTGFADGDLVGVSGADATYRLGAGGAALTRPRTTATVTLDSTKTTLAATIAPADATGAVTFRVGGDVLGSAPLVDGVARLDVTALAAGTYAVVAEYAGDARVAPATSAPLSHVVVPPTIDPGPDPDTGTPPGTGTPTSDGGGPATTPTPIASPPPAPVVPALPVAAPTSSPVAPAPAGAPAAAKVLSTVSAVRLGTAAVTFRQRFPTAGRATWRLTAGGTTLASRTATVKAGARGVALKLDVRARRLLRRSPTAKVVLRTTLVAADGTRVVVTRTLPRS